MAVVRVRSTDGVNSDDGSTWALAKLDIHTATTGGAASAGAGGTVYVSQAHAGSYSARVVYPAVGTLASPLRVVCVNDAATDPTATDTTATETTSSNGFEFIGATVYWYGITFVSTYASTASIIFSSYTTTHAALFESCNFRLGAASAGGINIGHNSLTSNARSYEVTWKNVNVKLPNVSTATISLFQSTLRWVGGLIESNTTMPTYLFTLTDAYHAKALISGVDLSELSGKTLVNAAVDTSAEITFMRCKLPASITLCTTPTSPNTRISMYGCDDSDAGSPHRFQIVTYAGTIQSETTIYATAGASDGTTPLSWKMVTSANAEWPLLALESDHIVQWNEAVGSSKTVTVEFLMDSGTTLYNDEVWMDVEYLGTSGQSQSTTDTDSKLATVLTTRAECTTGAGVGSWTGETAGAKSYKLVSTITPQEKGFIRAVVKFAKASSIIYVDPKLTIS